jgi:hypothetical protein
MPPHLSREAQIAASGGSIHEFRKSTRKMRWWYESMADYMIANPSATQDEIAAYFGRNPATISTIINADSFKAYFRGRRAQHAEKLDETVRTKLFNVANNSLDHLLVALEKKRDAVPIELLQRTADTALKNLGYGPPASPGVSVNVNTAPQSVNVAVSLDELERAREALRRNQQAVQTGPPLLEHEVGAIAPPPTEKE